MMEDDGNMVDLLDIKTFNGYNDIIFHVYNSPKNVDTVQMIRKNYKDGNEDGSVKEWLIKLWNNIKPHIRGVFCLWDDG